jgi:hypothetical protein
MKNNQFIYRYQYSHKSLTSREILDKLSLPTTANPLAVAVRDCIDLKLN